MLAVCLVERGGSLRGSEGPVGMASRARGCGTRELLQTLEIPCKTTVNLAVCKDSYLCNSSVTKIRLYYYKDSFTHYKESSSLQKSTKPKKRGRLRTRPGATAKKYILKHIEKSDDIVRATSKHFNISVVAVQTHLRQLQKQGRVVKEGRTRGTRWILAPSNTWHEVIQLKGAQEHLAWDQVEKALPKDLPQNVREIVRYGFTEMLNNAIDHSAGTKAQVGAATHGNLITLTIADNGVGIFKKIQKAFSLNNPRASILELTKGKVTTDPKNHSGQGIFFTSRAFDRFELASHELLFVKDNLNDDWLIDSINDDAAGTEVKLTIRLDSTTSLREIFDRYGDPTNFTFDKTHIVVELARENETEYISRSQAKRILVGLEKFRHVVLDFRNVRTVGQAFVDEVFRVFAQEHPDVKFEPINANENVAFMIQRGLTASSERAGS